jgi:hypothetical protein
MCTAAQITEFDGSSAVRWVGDIMVRIALHLQPLAHADARTHLLVPLLTPIGHCAAGASPSFARKQTALLVCFIINTLESCSASQCTVHVFEFVCNGGQRRIDAQLAERRLSLRSVTVCLKTRRRAPTN